MRFKWLIFCLMFSGLSCQVDAQSATVESRSYRVMLKKLLSHTVPEIGAEAAAEQRENAVFLDARESEEYAVSHISGAQLVGYDAFDISSVEEIDKDQPIIVYCSVGYRSEKVSEQLIDAGYTDVKNMYGGIFEWKNEDLPVVDSTDTTTERVHAFNRTWGIWLKNGEKVY